MPAVRWAGIVGLFCLAAPVAADDRPPAALLARLEASEAADREAAARSLSEAPPGDADILAGVTRLLAHASPGVRETAARLVGRLVMGDGQGVRGRERRRKASSRLHGHASEKAVQLALDWLARFQDPGPGEAAGRWDPLGFAKQADGAPIDGAGEACYEVGVTGLSLLAFLGAGYTDRGEHRYKDAVSAGLSYLLRVQAEDGCLGPRILARRSTNHAVGALALCEAWILTGDPRYRAAAQRAIAFLEGSRAPKKAWGYVECDHLAPDTHTTGWALAALGIARRGGLAVDEEGLRAGREWILSMQDDSPFGQIGYDRTGFSASYGGWEQGWSVLPDGSRMPMTTPLSGRRCDLFLDCERYTPWGAHSLALWCRLLLDPGRRPDRLKMAGIEIALEWPHATNMDACMWAYSALALAQLEPPAVAAKRTVTWFTKLHEMVLPRQRTDGVAKGSWDPADAWGSAGGRIYSTAMIVRALEAPYLYETFGEQPAATRAAIAALRRAAVSESEDGSVRDAAGESLRLIERHR